MKSYFSVVSNFWSTGLKFFKQMPKIFKKLALIDCVVKSKYDLSFNAPLIIFKTTIRLDIHNHKPMNYNITIHSLNSFQISFQAMRHLWKKWTRHLRNNKIDLISVNVINYESQSTNKYNCMRPLHKSIFAIYINQNQ